jgi:hypothetical protein
MVEIIFQGWRMMKKKPYTMVSTMETWLRMKNYRGESAVSTNSISCIKGNCRSPGPG